MEAGLLRAALLLLCMVDVLHSYAIQEREDTFKHAVCPAFLLFENAAYLADMTFELPCKCKPEEVSSVVWYFQKNMGGRETTVLTDFAGTLVIDSGHIHVGSDLLKRFSIRMFSLIVFRAQVTDSGHYLCGTKAGDYFYGYDVDVQPTQHIAVAFLDRGQPVQDDYTGKAFSLFTAFWDWTKCDRCGVRGEQRRIGLCYMRSARLHPRYHTALPNVTSCGSRAVPARLQRVHTHLLGRDLTIACPGARPEHAVAWDKGSVRLYRSRYLVGVNRSMRVFIDHGNHLRIRRVRLSDRGTYFCWREGRLVAGLRLSVAHQQWRGRSLDDPETIYAVKAIGASYVLIFAVFVGVHLCRCCRRVFQCPAR
ncbi:F187A protein, partial [Alectura lathami]|nr:F187A protein [Alectura lathami]